METSETVESRPIKAMSHLTEAEVDEELGRIPIVPLKWDKGKTGWKGVCLHRNTHFESKVYGVGGNQFLKIGRSRSASDVKKLALEWSKAMAKGNAKQRMCYLIAYKKSMAIFPEQLKEKEEEEGGSSGRGGAEPEKEGMQVEEDKEQLQQKVKELQQQVKELKEEIMHLQTTKNQMLEDSNDQDDEDHEEPMLSGVEVNEVEKEGKEEEFLSLDVCCWQQDDVCGGA